MFDAVCPVQVRCPVVTGAVRGNVQPLCRDKAPAMSHQQNCNTMTLFGELVLPPDYSFGMHQYLHM